MLQGFGYPVHSDASGVFLEGGHDLASRDVQVPSDVSSAAFFWSVLPSLLTLTSL